MASHSMPNGRGYGETKSPTAALARQSSIRKSSAGDLGSSTLPSLGTAGRLVDYEALIRHFDCPVCHDWVTPPIVQCRKGHIVCGPCKSKGLKACPVCKQRFSDVTNWMMEQVNDLLFISCLLYDFVLLFIMFEGVACHCLSMQVPGQWLQNLQRADTQDGPWSSLLFPARLLPVWHPWMHPDIALPSDGKARPRVPL